MEAGLGDILQRIRDGDTGARSDLIIRYKPFVLRAVSHVCKCRIGWNDDEASVGLIAFNEAIDRYHPQYGKSFDNFAYMAIHNRLVDEFRRKERIARMETKWHHEELELSQAEMASSLAAFEQQETSAALADELTNYDARLRQFGIRLEELEEASPCHRDTRRMLLDIARKFCTNPDWLRDLYQKRQLPLKDMIQAVEVSKKTLERNRKYLISLILILAGEEFMRIRQTLSFAELEED
ncbi:RNA polymerase sigma-I factor [Gorillibacterium sp. sgz5001074]|uniref:RNA polymerase sigma-I factor n=1 Tax=Gorillibacterium sp. sgz5001074 TaxID=3446695 RepID=UPI003F66C9AA